MVSDSATCSVFNLLEDKTLDNFQMLQMTKAHWCLNKPSMYCPSSGTPTLGLRLT